MCSYELCPSPMQSKKWRTVTKGTSAGGQSWDCLVGKMLCDSCYSTFRKHGTFVRAVRTSKGWVRMDEATGLTPELKSERKRAPAAQSEEPIKRKKTAVQENKFPSLQLRLGDENFNDTDWATAMLYSLKASHFTECNSGGSRAATPSTVYELAGPTEARNS